MENRPPKIFISYSWAKSSERVRELAERLMSDGIEVVLDQWELKEGQDKYAFMERCVVDEGIDRVLLICDESYAEKADARSGGVGDETMIITPAVYGKTDQEKFLPVVFEISVEGNPCLPKYLESKIFFDLSTDDEKYESEYEKLVRNIYGKPLYRKPSLGNPPAYLESETVLFSSVRNLIRQLQRFDGNNKSKIWFIIKDIINAFISALLELNSDNEPVETVLLTRIENSRPLRDLFADFIEEIVRNDLFVADAVTLFFEEVFNGIRLSSNSYREFDFEFYDFFIWEAFVSMVAVLFSFEKYQELNSILTHTYFLKNTYYEYSAIEDSNYCKFGKYMRMIEEFFKPMSKSQTLYTLSGDMLINRAKKPILTESALAQADTLLYQLSVFFNFDKCWFPTLYIYFKEEEAMWRRLVSRKYCQKILPLFGVSTIEEFKEKVSVCVTDTKISHARGRTCAANILSYINLEEIAIKN